MYKKIVNTGPNSYTYYYHNFKIEGKIRNICLGNKLGRAKTLLSRIMKERTKGKNNLPAVVKRCRKTAP